MQQIRTEQYNTNEPPVTVVRLQKQSFEKIYINRQSSKSAVGRLPTRATAGDALAAPVHAPTLRGPASPAHAARPPRANGRRDGARPRSASPLRDRTLPDAARQTQPLEPILFPKLRIRFADFPYLHYSID